MPDYTTIATKVRDGLLKAGTVMTLSQTSGGTFDHVTGTVSGETVTVNSLIGLIAAQSMTVVPQGEKFFQGVQVQVDDKLVILEARPGVVPAVGDKLTIGGVVFKIMAKVTLEPGGTAVMYKILVRR